MAEGGTERGTDKAVEGLIHVQAAAMEMIRAMRSFLDVAEDLVQDPGTARAVMSAFAALAQAARPAPPEAESDRGVERIVVE